MTKKATDAPDETAAPPKKREREFTKPPTSGGTVSEDGELTKGGIPEPDDHRLKKPER